MKKGFTVIELLVVISIIAILLAIIWPAVVGYRNRNNPDSHTAISRGKNLQFRYITPDSWGNINHVQDIDTGRCYNYRGEDIPYYIQEEPCRN